MVRQRWPQCYWAGHEGCWVPGVRISVGALRTGWGCWHHRLLVPSWRTCALLHKTGAKMKSLWVWAWNLGAVQGLISLTNGRYDSSAGWVCVAFVEPRLLQLPSPGCLQLHPPLGSPSHAESDNAHETLHRLAHFQAFAKILTHLHYTLNDWCCHTCLQTHFSRWDCLSPPLWFPGSQIRTSITALWVHLFPPPRDLEHLRARMAAYANWTSITWPDSWHTGAGRNPSDWGKLLFWKEWCVVLKKQRHGLLD